MAMAKERFTMRKELKFTSSDINDIAHAACISGSNESAFIREAAIEKARQVNQTERLSTLNSEDWHNFVNTVTSFTTAPAELKKNMASFLNQYKGDMR